jgi:hypothetical protein
MKRNKKTVKRAEPELAAGTARERTLSHLGNLMRTATTVGAGLAMACSARGQGPLPPQVCDPLPPPVGCCENPEEFLMRGCLNYEIHWARPNDAWTLNMSLWLRNVGGPTRMSFPASAKEDIKSDGATVKDFKIERGKMNIVLTPKAGKKEAIIELLVQCNAKQVPLKLSLDLSNPPHENGAVPVKVAK